MVIDRDSKTPIYRQLTEQLREEIRSGLRAPGSKLPSTRELSHTLGLGRNTVETAYGQLCGEGYLENRSRSGYYVAELLTPLSNTALERRELYPENKEPPVRYKLDYGALNSAGFPYARWKKCLRQAMEAEQSAGRLKYVGVMGCIALRRQLAAYLKQHRGVNTDAGRIAVGSGVQQLCSMLCRLLPPGSRVAMEEPGYDGIRQVFELCGFEIVPIPAGFEGIDISVLRGSGVKLAYVTPSHQFPLGSVMPAAQRLELIGWAASEDAWILEDDYDGELRYAGLPIPSLQGLDTSGHVIYMGTMSKSLSPTARIAYMALPWELARSYLECFSSFHNAVPPVMQEALALFMESGAWATHMRHTLAAFRRRSELFCGELERALGADFELYGKSAGLHVLIRSRRGLSEAEMLRRALRAGVRVYPVSAYYSDSSKSVGGCVMAGLGSLGADEIIPAARALALALRDSGN